MLLFKTQLLAHTAAQHYHLIPFCLYRKSASYPSLCCVYKYFADVELMGPEIKERHIKMN